MAERNDKALHELVSLARLTQRILASSPSEELKAATLDNWFEQVTPESILAIETKP